MKKTLVIPLSDELEQVLREYADRSNQSLEEIALQLLSQPFISPRSETDPLVKRLDSASIDSPNLYRYRSQVKAFQGLFDFPNPVPEDFDIDQSKWEHLKEKYNL